MQWHNTLSQRSDKLMTQKNEMEKDFMQHTLNHLPAVYISEATDYYTETYKPDSNRLILIPA